MLSELNSAAGNFDRAPRARPNRKTTTKHCDRNDMKFEGCRRDVAPANKNAIVALLSYLSGRIRLNSTSTMSSVQTQYQQCRPKVMTIRPAGPTRPPPLDHTPCTGNVRPPRIETPYPPRVTVETFPSYMMAPTTRR